MKIVHLRIDYGSLPNAAKPVGDILHIAITRNEAWISTKATQLKLVGQLVGKIRFQLLTLKMTDFPQRHSGIKDWRDKIQAATAAV